MAISDILSQEEINLLIKDHLGKSSAATIISSPDEMRDIVIEPIDFVTQLRKEETQIPGFHAINEKFSLSLSHSLSKFLQQRVIVTPLAPKTITFSDYVHDLEHPALLGLVHLKAPRSHLMIHIHQKLLYQTVNILFGGAPSKDEGSYQEFGKVDVKICHRLLGKIIECLTDSWSEFCRFEIKETQLVLRPGTITAIAPQRFFLVTSFLVSINQLKTEIQLAFEIEMLDAVKQDLNSMHQTRNDKREDKRWKEQFQLSVYDSVLPLMTAFPPITLKLNELSRLKEGDVIFLDNPQLVDVYIAGLKIFRAQCGVSQGTRVIKLVEYLG